MEPMVTEYALQINNAQDAPFLKEEGEDDLDNEVN